MPCGCEERPIRGRSQPHVVSLGHTLQIRLPLSPRPGNIASTAGASSRATSVSAGPSANGHPLVALLLTLACGTGDLSAPRSGADDLRPPAASPVPGARPFGDVPVESPTATAPAEDYILLASGAALTGVPITASADSAASTGATQHPMLLFGASRLASLRSDVTKAPRSGWYAAVKASAARGLDYSGRDEDALSAFARDMAFVHMLEGGVALRDGVAKSLRQAGTYDRDWNTFGWNWAGDLLNYALAYDWIQRALTPVEDAAIKSRLEAACQKTYDVFVRAPWSGALSLKYFSNVRLRIAGGLGAASLALGDHGDARARVAYIVDDLFTSAHSPPRQLAAVVARDGIYKEGASYQDDSFSVLTPFLLAYRRATGFDPFAGIGGFDDRLKRMYRSNIQLMMPNGRQPTTNTGWMDRLCSQTHEWVAPLLPDAAEQMWYWTHACKRTTAVPALGIVFFDPAAVRAARAPRYTSQIMPNAAIFRTGWTPKDTWLLLDSSDEACRSSHAQPGQTAIALYARGAYLLMDPGDGRDYPGGESSSQFAWLNRSAAAHNLVIIDGKEGPVGRRPATPSKVWRYDVEIQSRRDPAILGEGFTAPFLDYAETRIDGYFDAPDVKSKRSVFFPGKEYFAVIDELTSPHDHTYEELLHFGGRIGTGKIDGSLACGTGEATWNTWNDKGEQVELRVVFLNPDVTLSPRTGPTNFTRGQTLDHPYLRAAALGAQVDFLMLLLPRKVGESALRIRRLRGQGCSGGTVATGPGVDTHGVALGDGTSVSLGSVLASAKYVFVRAIGGRPTMLAVKRGTMLEYAGTRWLAASRPLTMAMDMSSPDSYAGSIAAPAGPVRLDVLPPTGRKATRVRLAGADVVFTEVKGMVSTNVTAGGDLSIEFASRR